MESFDSSSLDGGSDDSVYSSAMSSFDGDESDSESGENENLDQVAKRLRSNRQDATYRSQRMARIIASADKNNATESVLLQPKKVISFVNKTWKGVTRRNAYNQISAYIQQSDLSYSQVLKCLPLYRAERRKVDNSRSTSKGSGRTANLKRKMENEYKHAITSATKNIGILEKNLMFAIRKRTFRIKETSKAWTAATKALAVMIATENTSKHAAALRCADVEKMSKENKGYIITTQNLAFTFKKVTGALILRYANLRHNEFSGEPEQLLVNLNKKPVRISDCLARAQATEKPTCSICGKTFSSKSYFKVHLRIHLKEKPYICSVCDAAFADKSNLNKHILTHEQESDSEGVDAPE